MFIEIIIVTELAEPCVTYLLTQAYNGTGIAAVNSDKICLLIDSSRDGNLSG